MSQIEQLQILFDSLLTEFQDVLDQLAYEYGPTMPPDPNDVQKVEDYRQKFNVLLSALSKEVQQ